jgi:L-fuculose-phosphate aldolase
MMLLERERTAVCEYGRKLLTARLTTGSGGNLSLFNRARNLIAIKPSGVPYLEMQPEDVVVIDPRGRIVDGRLQPSSEVSFHLGLLNRRPDISAVVHTHQVYATAVACLGWELPAVHYLIGFAGDKVPLAPYATYGTQALADNIVSAIGGYNACLLANHGLVTVGKDLATAFVVAEELELVAQIYLLAKSAGEPVILPAEEMAVVVEKFKGYGQPQAR